MLKLPHKQKTGGLVLKDRGSEEDFLLEERKKSARIDEMAKEDPKGVAGVQKCQTCVLDALALNRA